MKTMPYARTEGALGSDLFSGALNTVFLVQPLQVTSDRLVAHEQPTTACIPTDVAPDDREIEKQN